MESFSNANTFFYISSIGFIIVALVLLVALIYLILFIKRLSAIAKKIEERFDTASEEMRELLDRLYDSALFRLFFTKKKHRARK